MAHTLRARNWLLSSFALTAVLAAVQALRLTRADEHETPVHASDSNSAIRQSLQRPIDLNLQQCSVSELAEAIRNQAKINVLVDDKALADAAVEQDARVQIELHNRPLAQTLSIALNPIELRAVTAHGALVITTKESAAAKLDVRTYPVSDLKGAPKKSIFGRDNRYQEIMHLITVVIQPTSWDDVGGPGTIARFDDVFTIGQTAEVHDRVADLLSYLRKAGDSQTTGVTEPLEFPDRIEERRLFNQRVSFDFDEVPLNEALDKLRSMCDGDFVLDGKALEEAAIAHDNAVTLKVHDMRLQDALHYLLLPLDLTVIYKDNVLLITTREAAAAELFTRIYPVGDLIDFKSTCARQKCADLIELVTSTIDPNTWDDVGGPGSIISFAPSRCVVISQTDDIHDEIHDLLKQLRAAPRDEKVGEEPDENEFVLRSYEPNLGVPIFLGGFQSDDAKMKSSEPSIVVEQVVDAIKTLVAPDTWRDDKAGIKPVGKYLYVRQTQAVHEDIEELLKALHYHATPKHGRTTLHSATGCESSD